MFVCDIHRKLSIVFILKFQGNKGAPGEEGPPGPDGIYIPLLVKGDKGERGPSGKDGIPCSPDTEFPEIIGVGARGTTGEQVRFFRIGD